MPAELGYFTISVPNVPQAMAFYGALFGWKFEQEFGAGSAHVANTILPLGISTGDLSDYANLYFKVTDIKTSIGRIASLGGSTGEVHSSPSGLSAVCEDDQGTVFSLWQPAPGYEG